MCGRCHVWLLLTPWSGAHQAPVCGIFQARILEWVVISFSRFLFITNLQMTFSPCNHIAMYQMLFSASTEMISFSLNVVNYKYFLMWNSAFIPSRVDCRDGHNFSLLHTTIFCVVLRYSSSHKQVEFILPSLNLGRCCGLLLSIEAVEMTACQFQASGGLAASTPTSSLGALLLSYE